MDEIIIPIRIKFSLNNAKRWLEKNSDHGEKIGEKVKGRSSMRRAKEEGNKRERKKGTWRKI